MDVIKRKDESLGPPVLYKKKCNFSVMISEILVIDGSALKINYDLDSACFTLTTAAVLLWFYELNLVHLMNLPRCS